MNTLYIIRGLPSSGKSSFADSIVGCENNVAADDWFYIQGNGTYAFDASKLHIAHKWCYDRIEAKMANGEPNLAVSNTSTRESDVNTYIKLAQKWGYRYFVIVVEKRHDKYNSHNVPTETMDKMEQQLKQNIKLR